jgi:hypothetical protein
VENLESGPVLVQYVKVSKFVLILKDLKKELIDEQIVEKDILKKVWYLYTMEFYSATKKK